MALSAQTVPGSEVKGEAANSEALSCRDIKVDATISWEALTLAGFSAAGAYWKYDQSPVSLSQHDDLDRSRDPGKLQDLLICQGSAGPIVPGSLVITPKPRLHLSRTPRFISPRFDDNEMHFLDAPHVEILNNGFSQMLGHDCWVTIRNFGLNWLKALYRENELSLSLAGDGLGEVRHWGCTARRGHTFGAHGQPIKALKLSAVLTAEGLQLDVEGELNDFEAHWIEANQKLYPGGKLEPISTFKVHAALPTALLQLRRLPCRRKAEEFAAP
jgi:hypothetical protein